MDQGNSSDTPVNQTLDQIVSRYCNIMGIPLKFPPNYRTIIYYRVYTLYVYC